MRTDVRTSSWSVKFTPSFFFSTRDRCWMPTGTECQTISISARTRTATDMVTQGSLQIPVRRIIVRGRSTRPRRMPMETASETLAIAVPTPITTSRANPGFRSTFVLSTIAPLHLIPFRRTPITTGSATRAIRARIRTRTATERPEMSALRTTAPRWSIPISKTPTAIRLEMPATPARTIRSTTRIAMASAAMSTTARSRTPVRRMRTVTVWAMSATTVRQSQTRTNSTAMAMDRGTLASLH